MLPILPTCYLAGRVWPSVEYRVGVEVLQVIHLTKTNKKPKKSLIYIFLNVYSTNNRAFCKIKSLSQEFYCHQCVYQNCECRPRVSLNQLAFYVIQNDYILCTDMCTRTVCEDDCSLCLIHSILSNVNITSNYCSLCLIHSIFLNVNRTSNYCSLCLIHSRKLVITNIYTCRLVKKFISLCGV